MSRNGKKRAFPHTYVIIFAIIVLAALLTWILPGGEFAREEVVVNGVPRSVVVPGSYTKSQSVPQHIQILPAIMQGLERTSSIFFYVVIIGGAFWILNTTRALDTAITGFLKRVNKLRGSRALQFIGVDNLIVTLIMLGFSFLGAVIGMSEEVIPFVVIFVPLAIRLGYDSIVGVSMCYLAAGVGFAGALLNPFSIGIAQGLAGIPLFSGIEYRVVIWLVLNAVAIGYVLHYMRTIRRDPSRSCVQEEDSYWREQESSNQTEGNTKASAPGWAMFGLVTLTLGIAAVLMPMSTLTVGQQSLSLPGLPILAILWLGLGPLCLRHSVQMFNVLLLAHTVLLLVLGVMGYDWYITEIASLFLAMGLIAGISFGYDGNTLVKHFVDGAKDILSAAIVIGLATAIVIILEQGRVIDTLLQGAANAMQGYGPATSLLIMFLFYCLLDFIIASASAKAALTIPLMSQFSDLVGITRQTTVTTYQLGSGFTHLASPTSGVLVGVLSIAKVPFVKWFRWFWPLMVIEAVVSFLLLLPPLLMEIVGF